MRARATAADGVAWSVCALVTEPCKTAEPIEMLETRVGPRNDTLVGEPDPATQRGIACTQPIEFQRLISLFHRSTAAVA